MPAEQIPGTDVVSYISDDGRPQAADLMVVVNPDGSSVGSGMMGRVPVGYEQIGNVTLSAVTALQSVPLGAVEADIQNNGSQNVRFRDDGVAPTDVTGQRIYAGDTKTYRGNLSAIRFLRESDGVTLDILYYGAN